MSISKQNTFKRYCKTMDLENDPELIKKYKRFHQNVWPEIPQGMKEVGILDMEIYIFGTRLFMIMDTVAGFDHEMVMNELARQPRQSEWEAYVSQFQQTSEEATADDKWQLMERIFKMDQPTEERNAIDGQIEEGPGI